MNLPFPLSALVFLALVVPGAAGGHPEARVDGPPIISVARGPEGGHLLNASFAVTASRDVAWQVLTDYAELPRFVESMKRSVVVTRTDRLLQVEQEGAGRLGFVSRRFHVLLTIQEHPSKNRLDFHDTCGESFGRYRGAWTVEPRAGHTVVTYQLEADPRFFAPGPLASRATKSNVHSLLEGVRSEMVRRARFTTR